MPQLPNCRIFAYFSHKTPKKTSTFLCAAYTALGLHRRMITVIKPQLAIARLRLHASELSICLSICLSVRLSVCRQNAKKTAIFSKTKQFRAMVSINDL